MRTDAGRVVIFIALGIVLFALGLALGAPTCLIPHECAVRLSSAHHTAILLAVFALGLVIGVRAGRPGSGAA